MAVITENAGGVRDQQSQTSPKQAVQKESILTQLAPTISKGMQVAESVFAQKAESEANAGLASFRESQSTLLEIAKQFPERKREAITRLNANLNSYGQQNPHLLKDIEKLDNDLRNKVGLGKEVFEESPQELADKQDMEEGIQLGMIDPNASPEVQQSQMNQLRVTKGKLHNASVRNAEYNETRLKYQKIKDKASAEAAVLKTKADKQQMEFYSAFADTAQDALGAFDSAAQRIIAEYNAGNYDETTAKIALNQLFATSTAAANGFKAQGAEREDINAILAPITSLKDTYITALGKEWQANDIQKQVDIQVAKSQLQTLADNPQTIQAVALSRLFGDGFKYLVGEFLPMFNDMADDMKTMKMVVKPDKTSRVGSVGMPNTGVTRQDVKATVATVDAMTKGANEIKTSEGDREAHSYIDKAFEGVDVYSQGVADPVANKGLLELIALKSTGELVARTGGFTPETAEKVTLLMEQQFLQPMSKVIADHWKKGYTFKAPPAFSGGMEMPISVARDTDEVKPYRELAKPVFKGGQLTFVGVGSGHKQERMAVMELNNKVRPQLQLMIQASAHTGNDMDYNKAWEEMAPALFPEMFQFDGVTGADNKRNPRLAPEPKVWKEGDTIKVGDVVNGQKYMGGGTSNPDNWVQSDE